MSWLARAFISSSGAMDAGLAGADAYAWHRAAWQAFPGIDGERRPFLSRLDVTDDGFTLYLLCRDHEPRIPPWCPDAAWAVKPIAPTFIRARTYRFDLRANPTRRVVKLGEDGQPTKNGCRKPLDSLGDQIGWLERKASAAGFNVVDVPEVGVRQDQVFRKHGSRGVHTGVRFQGLLEVTEPDVFKTAFFQGIGSAKGFGFGMLLLQPIHP